MNRLDVQGPQLFFSLTLAKKLGLETAIFLEKLHYWITHPSKDIGVLYEEKRWIYNTTKEWLAQMDVMSERKLQRIIATLKKEGIIRTESLNPHKQIRTNYYTIDYDQLKKITSIKTDICPHKEFQDLVKMEQNLSSKESKSRCQNNTLSEKIASTSCQNGDLYIRNTLNTSKTYSSLSQDEYDLQHSSTQTDVSQERENNQEVKEKHSYIAQTLITIWNEIIENGQNKVQITKNRVQFLLSAFHCKFQNSLEKWKEFCHKIATSRFLMGEITSFKATVDWVLKFSNMQKILEGNYKTGDRDVFKEEEVSDKSLNLNKCESPRIQKIRKSLYQDLGAALYKSWFQGLYLEEKAEKILVRFSSSFQRDYIQTHFWQVVEKILGRDVMVLD